MKSLPRLLVATILGSALAGCGSSSGSGSTGTSISASTAASSGTIATTASAHFPAAANVGSSSKSGPAITITSPVRASFTTQAVAKVEGTVSDPDGVGAVVVQGVPITFASSGAFATAVALTPGVNTIVVEAYDKVGHRSKAAVSVISGEFASTAQPVHDAIAVRLNQGAFDAIARGTAGQLGGPVLAAQVLALNPLYSGKTAPLGLTIVSAEVNATAASFGSPSVALTPQTGSIALHAEIPQVDLTVEAHSIGGLPYSVTGHLTADRAVVNATCVVTSGPGGQFVTQMTGVSTTLENFHWGLNGFPSALTGLATKWVKSKIENTITSQIQNVVPREIDKALAIATAPIRATVLNAPTTFTFAPTTAGFDPAGASLVLDTNVLVAPRAGYVPPASPGSFVSRGAAPIYGPTAPAFCLSINEDLMNRATHEAWHGGYLDFVIDTQSAQKLGLPGWLVLNAGLIQAFVPQLQGKMPATDPIAIEISSQLPPVFRARSKPDTLEAGLGEMRLDLYDVAGGTRKLIVSLAIHGRVKAAAQLTPSNVVKIGVNGTPWFDVSVLDSPIVKDLDTIGVGNFIQFSVPPIVQIFAGSWPGYPLPLVPGVQPRNVDVDADGPKKSYVTVKGDL